MVLGLGISSYSSMSSLKLHPLTSEEKDIIIDKGTEYPGTGEYLSEKRAWVFVCRQCELPLFTSDAKFDSGCGWPSFEEWIPGNVRETLDSDGRRTEITCERCGGHIGHVFHGEQFTPRDTRHCANSLSLRFRPYADMENIGHAVFAAGCFWWVQYYLAQIEWMLSTSIGYTGGMTEYPKYSEVCTGWTGHIEAVEVWYDTTVTDYETLAKVFFEIHDFTQEDGQGPDIWEQYLSAIFVTNSEQRTIAEKLIADLSSRGYKVATMIRDLERFWIGESYHQNYYPRTGKTPYCHVRRKIW